MSRPWLSERISTHQAKGTMLVIKQLVRSCRRWQLLCCSRIYEETTPRHAPGVSLPTSKPIRPRVNKTLSCVELYGMRGLENRAKN